MHYTRIVPVLTALVGVFVCFAAGSVSATELSGEEKGEGFVALFDGKRLNGWQGATDLYTVEHAKLVYRPIKRARSASDLVGLSVGTGMGLGAALPSSAAVAHHLLWRRITTVSQRSSTQLIRSRCTLTTSSLP